MIKKITPHKSFVELAENEINLAIFCFKPGSTSGIDSLKLQHIEDLPVKE